MIDVTSQPPRGWLNLEAPLKRLFALLTLLTSQPLILPLKAGALAKVDSIVVTLVVFQFIIVEDTPVESPLLKIVAPLNIPWRVVALEVFQLERSWLNTTALKNILVILVTLPTLHPLILPLKAVAPSNIFSIFSTLDVSHCNVLDTPEDCPLLKTGLLKNVSCIFVTLPVSQPERSWLNIPLSLKVPLKYWTLDVFQLFSGWSKLSAFLNVLFMFVTPETFHPFKFLSNAIALQNIPDISVKLVVVHPEIFLLNTLASLNISCIWVTLETSQLSIFSLNIRASWNISSILVTLLTSQLSNGWLKICASLNAPRISVIVLVSQLFNGWLNDLQFSKIKDIELALDKSQLSKGWLKLPLFL